MFYKSMYAGAALCAISFGGFAQGNQADIKQNGSGNAHTVEQFGTNGTLTLTQGTGSHHSTDNTALVKMGGDQSEVFIQQVGGPTSSAEVYTGGIGNYAKVKQDGAAHQAYISQGLAFPEPNEFHQDNTAKIDQQGDSQEARIVQGYDNKFGGDGGAKESKAKIEQRGSGNSATTTQGIAAGSRQDYALTKQDGVHNTGFVTQGVDGFGSVNNQAKIEQKGQFNEGYVRQGTGGGGAYDNIATLKQIGEDNRASVSQGDGSVAEASEAEVEQNGNLNRATLYQGYDFVDATQVKGTILQHGNLNEATLYQAGHGHVATIQQNGTGNTSLVAQGVMLPTP